jgi:hypothetical protein
VDIALQGLDRAVDEVPPEARTPLTMDLVP